MHKLDAYGIKGKLHRWIGAFLAGRRQRVLLGESVSEWAAVTSGVPQGSVLGPLLFLLYINDLPECLLNPSKLFADDTKIFGTADDDEATANLQFDIDNAARWSSIWLMDLHKHKSVIMHVGKKNRQQPYFIGIESERKAMRV